jgi:hypothetical protein
MKGTEVNTQMQRRTPFWTALVIGALGLVCASPARAQVGTDTWIIVQGKFIGEQLITVAGMRDVPASLNRETSASGRLVADPIAGQPNTFVGRIRGESARGTVILFNDATTAVQQLSAAVMSNLRAWNDVRTGGAVGLGLAQTEVTEVLADLATALDAINQDLLDLRIPEDVAARLRSGVQRSQVRETAVLSQLQNARPSQVQILRAIMTAQQSTRNALAAVVAANA